MKRTINLLLITLLLAFVGQSCKSTKTVVWTPVGSWDYTVSGTPDGDVSGVLTLTEEGDGYTGMISSDAGQTELTNVKIEGNTFSANMNYSGYQLDLEGTFAGESLKGTIGLGYDTFTLTATRKQPG